MLFVTYDVTSNVIYSSRRYVLSSQTTSELKLIKSAKFPTIYQIEFLAQIRSFQTVVEWLVIRWEVYILDIDVLNS
jgi:hypothetical protein